YTYCGLGKRVMKVKDGNTTIYYPDGLNTVVEMYKGSTWSEFSITAVYTLAPGAIGQIISVRQYGATTTDLYYHYDPIGNVQFITDSYGNTTVSYVQEGFGNVIATLGSLTSNFYHLTTKELDPDTGLYYFGGRWYDPVIGRWITKSPLRPDVEHPYGYVENDPINLTDSNGLVADYIWDIGVVGYDIYSLYKEPSWENAGYLGLDVVLGVIPFVPSGVGPAAKGIKCGVKLSKAEKIDNLTKLARLKYPKLAGKTHLHHVRPFYLGGTRKGATVAIDAAYHQMITNAIRKEFPYGKSWKEQFNEDLLKEIYEKYPLPK
ncbi:MAG: RHS repeat domain-containing protein, partial [bacterium]